MRPAGTNGLLCLLVRTRLANERGGAGAVQSTEVKHNIDGALERGNRQKLGLRVHILAAGEDVDGRYAHVRQTSAVSAPCVIVVVKWR